MLDDAGSRAPGLAVNYDPFVRAVARSLRSRCGVGEGDRVIVAVSGGADSVALLRAMAILAPRRAWRLDLTVAHVQHHLRPSAETDAAFVAELAARLRLPLLREDVHPAGQDAPGRAAGNLEAKARRLRYAALARLAARCDARFVAVAHHGDDQLETILLRLARGTSARGLAAMAWRRSLQRSTSSHVTLVRPMLAVTHADAVGFLDRLDQPWRHDPTNDDVSRARARLRRDVLPAMHAVNPHAARHAVQLADQMRRLDTLLERQTDDALRQLIVRPATAEGCVTLDRRAARRVPADLLAAVLRRVLADRGVEPDRLTRRLLTPIVRAAADDRGGRRTFTADGGTCIVVDREHVRIEAEPRPAPGQ